MLMKGIPTSRKRRNTAIYLTRFKKFQLGLHIIPFTQDNSKGRGGHMKRNGVSITINAVNMPAIAKIISSFLRITADVDSL
mmetsp:Transcript_63732/g.74660  ORF Transcript_63732/g.74660 Transcript_63732/m.74660 type:complete len:81 (-) Transcript_63732:21-263(-)